MNKNRCNALLPLVQLLPAVAAATAVLFALPRTVPVLAAVPERLTAVVEQPAEAASSEAEEEVLPKLPYADGVYVGSSRGYGGTVRVQVTMESGSITEVEILDASHETKQFLRRAKRLLTTVVETQSWEVDAVSEATYTSRGILGAVQNALTGEVVNNPLPPQPKPTAPLVVEEFTAPSTYLDGIYTAEAMGFEGKITVQITVAEDQITDITLLSAEDEEEYLSRAKQVIPAILEGQNPNVDAVSGATYSSTGILNAVKLALTKALLFSLLGCWLGFCREKLLPHFLEPRGNSALFLRLHHLHGGRSDRRFLGFCRFGRRSFFHHFFRGCLLRVGFLRRGNRCLCQCQLDRVQDAAGGVGGTGNGIHVGTLSFQNGGDDPLCPGEIFLLVLGAQNSDIGDLILCHRDLHCNFALKAYGFGGVDAVKVGGGCCKFLHHQRCGRLRLRRQGIIHHLAGQGVLHRAQNAPAGVGGFGNGIHLPALGIHHGGQKPLGAP